jgi:protein-tyrosine phosphatase
LIVDAGGLPVAAGGRLRKGRVMRVSGGLLLADDVGDLERHGLRALVDLRGHTEDRTLLEGWAAEADVRYVWLPIDAAGAHQLLGEVADAADASAAAGRLQVLYERMLSAHGAELAGAISVIAEGTPVAFGCAAGKDRTGLVAALLQVLLGVDEEVVSRSDASSPPTVDRLRAMVVEQFGVDDELAARPGFEVLLGADAETMQATLAHLRSEHGGVAAYLEAHGLTAAEVERLRADLVESPVDLRG